MSLDKIILLFCCIAEVYMLFDLFHSFFDVRENIGKRQVITISVVSVAIIFIINMFGNALLNLFSVVIVFALYTFIIFEAPLGQRILYFVIAFSIFWGCEFLFVILMGIPTYFVKQSSVVDLAEVPWHMFTMKVLNYLLFVLVKQFFSSSKEKMDGKIFAMYICLPITSLIMMLATYYSGLTFQGQPGLKILMTICCGVMLFSNILIFYAFNMYSEELHNNVEQKIIITRQEMDLEYFKQINEVRTKHYEMVHNISNYLKVINELLKQNEIGRIEELIKNLNGELENSAAVVYSDNPVLNAVLNEKTAYAESVGVTFDVFVEPGLNVKKVNDMDLINMLGNLLDNAIRAAMTCEPNQRKVCFKAFMQNEGNFCVTKITNLYCDEILKDTKGNYVTTKKEKGIHGIGIQSVQKAAEKNGGYLECVEEKNQFTAILVL